MDSLMGCFAIPDYYHIDEYDWGILMLMLVFGFRCGFPLAVGDYR